MVGRFDKTRTIVRLAEGKITPDTVQALRQSEISAFNKKLALKDEYNTSIISNFKENDQCYWVAAVRLGWN